MKYLLLLLVAATLASTHEVLVGTNQTLTVDVHTNPSTGFHWWILSDPGIELVSRSLLPLTSQLVGARRIERLVFIAHGSALIHLTLLRGKQQPFENAIHHVVDVQVVEGGREDARVDLTNSATAAHKVWMREVERSELNSRVKQRTR